MFTEGPARILYKTVEHRAATRLKSASSGGALLTEILVCLALMIPVVALLAALFPYSYSVDQAAWRKRTAQTLATSTLEQLRGQPFEEVASGSREEQVGNVVYRLEIRVEPDGDSPPREKLVSCLVEWDRKNGTDRLELQTRLARLYQQSR